MRVKVSRRPEDRMDVEDVVVVAVGPQPAVAQGDLKAEVERLVLTWVELNAEALVDYWDGRLDAVELSQRLVRLPG